MYRTLIFIAAIIALGSVAAATPDPVQSGSIYFSDDQYITEYFGTKVVIISSEQLADPNVGWWTDRLPDELQYGSSFAVGVVNAHRLETGDAELLNLNDMVMLSGWEEVVEAGYMYTLDFIGIRPSEVELLFNALGGLDKFLPGVELSYEPLLTRNFFAMAEKIGSPLEFTIGSRTVEIDTNLSITEIREKLGSVLEEEFGSFEIPFLYLNYSIYEEGESVDLSFDVELPAG